MKTVTCTLLILFFATVAQAQVVPWNQSPQNWNNSPQNWQNSPMNWKNSPQNWQNSPQRWDNDRIIRDNDGRATGYAVPKSNGGVNFYDFNGERDGYMAGDGDD